MNEQDRIWLEKCRGDWNYTVFVDNDEIFVVDKETDEAVHTFNDYGYEFAKSLLAYIGCNTESV